MTTGHSPIANTRNIIHINQNVVPPNIVLVPSYQQFKSCVLFTCMNAYGVIMLSWGPNFENYLDVSLLKMGEMTQVLIQQHLTLL